MAFKKFVPSAKNGKNSPNKKLAGLVGKPGTAKKGPTAKDPKGNVDVFFQPNKPSNGLAKKAASRKRAK